MKVGIDARFLTEEYIGIGRYSHSILKEIAVLDPENEYVIFKSPRYPGRVIEQDNFREVVVRSAPISPGTLFSFGRVLGAEKLDVFHSHFYITPFAKPCRQALTVHDIIGLMFPRYYSGRNYVLEKMALWFHRALIPRAVRQSDIVITESEYTKERVLELVPGTSEDTVEVIYLGTDPHFCPRDEGEVERVKKSHGLSGRYFFYVGNTKLHKNLTGLTAAFSALLESSREYRDIKLVIAGKKDRFFPSLKKHVASLAYGNSVLYRGYIADEELPALHAGALAFVFPGFLEGFGLPVLEAMACGAPVITSNASSLPEVAGDAAILLDPRDTEGFTRAMQRVADDEGLRTSMGAKSVDRARTFSWRKAAMQTIAAYERLCC